VQGTRGAELHEMLDKKRITAVFRKGIDPTIDSYSGFFDNGHKKATGLGDWVRDRKITKLFVMGLATDYCVKFTVLDARQLGLEVVLVEDGCRAVNLAAGDDARAIEAMREAGASVVHSDTVTAR
jgi:nicotinamidase/pyrazinamidase